jgi:acyl-CoA synthetase (AMP-forming)/AMP-acid ligase II
VVLAAGASVGEEELLAHCRAGLARYKVPKAIRFVDELPRAALGKVLKDELRESLARGAAL